LNPDPAIQTFDPSMDWLQTIEKDFHAIRRPFTPSNPRWPAKQGRPWYGVGVILNRCGWRRGQVDGQKALPEPMGCCFICWAMVKKTEEGLNNLSCGVMQQNLRRSLAGDHLLSNSFCISSSLQIAVGAFRKKCDPILSWKCTGIIGSAKAAILAFDHPE
jgi:hypothetical protein